MNDMCGIEHVVIVNPVVSPLQGLLPFNAVTQGFTLGFNITPLRG